MRKILAITGYRSDYTKLKSVLTEIKKDISLQLEIVAFGTHLLDDYGNTIEEIKKDKHNIVATLFTNVEGSNTAAMSKSIGLAIIELTTILSTSKPDIVLLVGDRYEIIAAAIAATINNIPVAHIQGGEISGTIDEVLRHSITKLSHIHLSSTEKSKKRIIKMGENPNFVFNVGCPAIDFIKNQKYIEKAEMNMDPFFKKINLDFNDDYFILIQHPVTTEYAHSGHQMMEVLEAVQQIGIQTILIYPNPDAGSTKMLRSERIFSSKYKKNNVFLEKIKNISFKNYLNLLRNCSCLIGNSSSGIREAHAFDVPVINVGTRQQGRERTKNIIDVPCNRDELTAAIEIYKNKRIKSTNLYGDGDSGQKIAKILHEIDLKQTLNKVFHDEGR